MKSALLVIDIQKDYFEGGKYPLVDPLEAAKNAYMLLQCFREHNGQHVHNQHISLKPDAAFFIKGDSGSDIHDSVAHFEHEPFVYKHYPNSFRETNLLEMLKEWAVERVVICGMMTHMCVDAKPRRQGVVEKCTFCSHRIDRGLAQGLIPGVDPQATPACVNVCPVGARVFGDINDAESPVSKYLTEHETFRLREDLGTEPKVHYVRPEKQS